MNEGDTLKFKEPPVRDGLRTMEGKDTGSKKDTRDVVRAERRKSKDKCSTGKSTLKLERLLTVDYKGQSVELFYSSQSVFFL